MLCFGGIAQAAVPVPSLPSGPKWAIDYGDKYCSLTRKSGDPALPELTLRLIPGHSVPEVLVLGMGWRPAVVQSKIQLVLGPGAERMQGNAVPIRVSGSLVRGVGIDNLPPWFVEHFASAQTLALEQKGRTVLSLSLDKADKAVTALRRCNDRLLTAWGVDLKARAALKAEAMPVQSPNSWFNSEDYPLEARDRATSGTVVARYTVEPSGAITRCEAVGSSGSKVLDSATCALVTTRARYHPAIGPTGAPTASQVVVTINWLNAQ